MNFKIVKSELNNGLLGLHQAHDKEGNPIKWKAGTDGTGTFEKMPEYIQGADGKAAYKEASITIFEGNFIQGELDYMKDKTGDSKLTKEEMMVSTLHMKLTMILIRKR